MHSEEQIALRVIKTGASGYLSKDTADTELVNAVKQVLSGRKYITAALAEQLAQQLENPQDSAPEEYLSDREYQTFILIGQGKTVSQIAEELSLSNSTVGTYRARILEKMNMNNNAELINYAVKRGLV
jgi:DNA-binding NarL/FixJ family response regulator